ncbi:MAG: malectin domain-containing carbohydrate-binding protein [Marinagarivorans sp.]|nr:malectin domain-containing carbohydrate-binding protein [Marinagarivorans sp.]
MKTPQLTLIALTVLLTACVATNNENQSSSAAATESSAAAVSSVAVSSIESSSIAASSSSQVVIVVSSSTPASSSSTPVSSSSTPVSSSSVAASSSSAAPVYEFDRVAGKTAWEKGICAACHGDDASITGLNSNRAYSWIVNYMNTGSRPMPPFGARCNNQCAKDVAAYIVYDIYKKPLPNLQKPSVGINDVLAINAGSGDEVDSDGVVYTADAYFEGGSILTTSDVISGSANAAVQTARTGSFSYAIPMVNGFYVVELGMSELYYQAEGERVFNVSVENQMMNDIDLVKVAGHDVYAPLTFGHVEVTDGVLNINVTAGEGVLNLITVKESLE